MLLGSERHNWDSVFSKIIRHGVESCSCDLSDHSRPDIWKRGHIACEETPDTKNCSILKESVHTDVPGVHFDRNNSKATS